MESSRPAPATAPSRSAPYPRRRRQPRLHRMPSLPRHLRPPSWRRDSRTCSRRRTPLAPPTQAEQRRCPGVRRRDPPGAISRGPSFSGAFLKLMFSRAPAAAACASSPRSKTRRWSSGFSATSACQRRYPHPPRRARHPWNRRSPSTSPPERLGRVSARRCCGASCRGALVPLRTRLRHQTTDGPPNPPRIERMGGEYGSVR